jgi:hypothetical protein
MVEPPARASQRRCDEIFSEGAEIVYGDPSRSREQNKKRKREYEMKNAGMELETAPRRGTISEIIEENKD